MCTHIYIVHTGVVTPGPDGCPRQTKGCSEFGCPNTCYCEDRCNWERCKLSQPPKECLRNTNSTWQQEDNHWTARSTGVLSSIDLTTSLSYF